MSSSVTERHRGLGSWSLDLVADTPADVRRQLHLTKGHAQSKGYAMLVVTPQAVDLASYPNPADPVADPHPLLAAARWSGVVLESNRRRTQLAGAGLLAYLGDEDGVGHMHLDLTDGRVSAPASTLVTRLIGGGTLPNTIAAGNVTFDVSPLRVGTILASPVELSIGDQLLTTRAWLEDVSTMSGNKSYRVRPDGRVDWGPRTDIWGVFPRVIVGRLPATDDPRWVTVRTDADFDETLNGFADQAVADTVNPIGAFTTAAPPSAAFHSPIRMDGLTRRTEVKPTADVETQVAWAARAGEALTADDRDRSTIAATELTGIITPPTALEPGESIYLYDPEAGLVDTTNAETYAGEVIAPVARYLEAVEWPIVQGMGVYLLYVDRSFGHAQRILDLTEYVDYETNPETRLEVGAPAPTL